MEASKKERILVVAEKEREVYRGLINSLSKKYIVKELYVGSNHDNPPYILIKWFSVIKIWKDGLKKFKPAKIIICGGSLMSLWMLVFLIKLFLLKAEIILFRYDIEHFWPSQKGFSEKFRHFIALVLEKFCLLRADKILHKGLKTELELLPFYKKIKDKPHYLFREFLDKNLVQECDRNIKLSKKDGKIHLVYVGGLYLKTLPSIESFWDFYPKITAQKIHLHIYSKQPEEIVKKLEEIERRDSYFHYEGFMEHDALIKDIPKYDYGIHLFGGGMLKKVDLNVAFSNKNYDYLSAGLPIIVSNNLEATNEFVTNNKIGFSIEYEDLLKLKDKVVNNDTAFYLENIRAFIKKCDTVNLLEFIDIKNHPS